MRVVAALLGVLLAMTAAVAAPEDDPHDRPVAAVGPLAFDVVTSRGRGMLRYFGTGSLDGSPAVTRAIVDIHGLLRNADVYEQTGETALAAAHAGPETLLITPQFTTDFDVRAHALPNETLAWNKTTWIDGRPALAPAPIGAFAVLDAIARRLADRARFPALREIVFLGHSAGGQLIDRYAVVGDADAIAAGIGVRYVIANPSSYLYFDAARPRPNPACVGFDAWKFGFDGGLPPGVDRSSATYEARFITRHVTYMLGQADTDPHQAVLDISCQAETQGAYRLERGRSFTAYLRARHPGGTQQRVVEIEGVGHDAVRMFTSACGVAVIFDRPRTACAADRPV